MLFPPAPSNAAKGVVPATNHADDTTTPNGPPQEGELGSSALQSVPTIKKASMVSIVTRSRSTLL